jgi:hypothetical protein
MFDFAAHYGGASDGNEQCSAVTVASVLAKSF